MYKFYTASIPQYFKFIGHNQPVKRIDWLDDDTGFVTCGQDATINVWKLYPAPGEVGPAWSFKLASKIQFSSVACFSPERKPGDGEGALEPFVYAAGADRSIREITKDKDKESNNDECRLDSVSPTGRKRSQSPFSSGPPTRSTSALSHENSIPTDTNEYCPIVKKPKPNVLETELTEPPRSTYGLDEKPANSTSCMEPIPLASSQLKSGHSDNDPKVTFFILTNCI